MLTLERLKELVYYDKHLGIFVNLLSRGSIKVGNRADKPGYKGYRRISLDGKYYKAHRVAWFYMTGSWPGDQIDHIDGDKSNNRFHNLRDVSQTINMYNKKKAHKNNSSGTLGVSLWKNKYYARIKVGERLKYLGTFSTAEEAGGIYQQYKQQMLSGS